MSGKAVDYSTTPVSFYKFVCDDVEIKSNYVGHTTNFTKRKSQHKGTLNSKVDKNRDCKLYATIRENGGWENWKMIEIESRLVKDKREAERIEQEYMEQLQTTLNTQRSYYTENPNDYDAKYYQEHKEEIAIQKKAYREDHKEENALKHKEQITCECGRVIRKNDLSRHKKTQKHQDLMETKIP